MDCDEAEAHRSGGRNSVIPAPTRTHEKEELPCKQVEWCKEGIRYPDAAG